MIKQTFRTASSFTYSPIDHSSFTYSPPDQVTGSTVAGTTTPYGYADTSSDERTTLGNTRLTNGILGLTYTATGSGSTTQQTEHIRDPAGTLITMRTNDNNTSWASHYYTTDRLGSTLILTSGTGTVEATYTYDAWGNLTSPAPTAGTIAARNPYRYATGYTDPTGLIKFGTRYYNPTLGDWTQIDPASSGINYFAYASDNPITNVDQSGRWDWPAEDSEYNENGGQFDWGSIASTALSNAAVGAGVGASIGSVVPGAGTLAGAVEGGLDGAAIGVTAEVAAQSFSSNDSETIRQIGEVSHWGSLLQGFFKDD